MLYSSWVPRIFLQFIVHNHFFSCLLSSFGEPVSTKLQVSVFTWYEWSPVWTFAVVAYLRVVTIFFTCFAFSLHLGSAIPFLYASYTVKLNHIDTVCDGWHCERWVFVDGAPEDVWTGSVCPAFAPQSCRATIAPVLHDTAQQWESAICTEHTEELLHLCSCRIESATCCNQIVKISVQCRYGV